MTEHQLSAEAVSIGSMTRFTQSSLLTAATAIDRKSVAVLGVAVILAALPQATQADPHQIENILRLFPGIESASDEPASVRFVEFIRSLSIWVDAIAPEMLTE
ncbi:MAG TPA: hypothetical protein VKT76_15950 [Bradyrhizobium sp.]|nr:hypothetical protein [Bradyrhizobium sp.]